MRTTLNAAEQGRSVALVAWAWLLSVVPGSTEAEQVGPPSDLPALDQRRPVLEQCIFQAPRSGLAWPASGLASDPVPSSTESSKVPSSFVRTPESVIRIVNRFHVVRRADGSGGLDETLIDAMMRDLNYGFRNTPFVFVRDPAVVYVDNDTYYNDFPTFRSAFDMIASNFETGIMSWFATPNINGAVAGTWIEPASPHRGILMAYSTIGSPANIVTPTHEMGHIFQMYHPYETVFGTECTSGSNCTVAGDLVCDTPASPVVFGANTTATGIYFANQPGPCTNDPPYSPNPRLYMDAGWDAGHILRNQFSQGEVDRALSFLSPTSQWSVADLVGAQRPDILVDCDSNGMDDIDEILSGAKQDLGRDLVPDVCQVFPAEGDLVVTGMAQGPNNRLRYYDGTTGAWKGDLWNGMSFVHQARQGPDGLVYLARLNIIQRVSLLTGRTVDNFIDGVLEGAGIFVDLLFDPSGHILALDNTSQNVRRYNGTTGAFMGEFFSIRPGTGFAPKYMEYGPDGDIFVVGNGSSGNHVLRFDGDTGQDLGSFVAPGAGGLVTGQGLVFNGAHLYVANGGANNVLRYDAASGAFDREFVGSANGGLNNPHSLRFGPDGHLYVASRGTNSVKRYDGTTGAYLGDFVLPGAGGTFGTGGLSQPAGLLFAQVPPGRGVSINPGMNGAWTNFETLGQGMFFDVVPEQGRLFMGWFTYETDTGITLPPGQDEHRWMVAIGPYDGDTATLELLAVDGGTFNGTDPVVETPVGTAIVRFDSCTEAHFQYQLDAGLQGAMTLHRLLPDTLCAELSGGEGSRRE